MEQTNTAPLSIELAPYYANKGVGSEEVDDAVNMWARMTGVTSKNWTEPEFDVEIRAIDYGRLRSMSNWLYGVSHVLNILMGGTESTLRPDLLEGLMMANIALAGELDAHLDLLALQAEAKRNEAA